MPLQNRVMPFGALVAVIRASYVSAVHPRAEDADNTSQPQDALDGTYCGRDGRGRRARPSAPTL